MDALTARARRPRLRRQRRGHAGCRSDEPRLGQHSPSARARVANRRERRHLRDHVTSTTADIATATPTLANVPFRAASGYLEVPAGTYRVRITSAGTKAVAIDVNNVALTAGQVRTAVAVDAPGGGAPLGAILLADKN